MEYKVIKLNSQNLENLLNELGKEGWNLVTIYENQLIFSRFILTHINTSTTDKVMLL